MQIDDNVSKRSALQQNERGRSQQPSSFGRIEGKVFCLLFFGNSSDIIKEKKECGNKSWARKGSLSRKRTGFREKKSKGGRGGLWETQKEVWAGKSWLEKESQASNDRLGNPQTRIYPEPCRSMENSNSKVTPSSPAQSGLDCTEVHST